MAQRLGLFGILLLLLAGFLGINLLTGNTLRRARLDLTQGSMYTLTRGTKNIARSPKEPITLTFFYSRQTAQGRSDVEAYARRVRELLEEFERAGQGKIVLRVVDPEPFTESEDEAVQAGMQGIPVGPGESLYFGLVGTNTADGREVIPVFDPGKDRFLEYDIARIVSALAATKKPVIGVLAGLQVFGGYKVNRMTRQPEPTRQYQVFDELKQLYDVRTLDPAKVTNIDTDIELLVVVHPKQFAEPLQYAIDQFVLRGGRLMLFQDPYCEADDEGVPYGVEGKSSGLPKLLAAWGVQMPEGLLATDQEIALPVQVGSRSALEQVPYVCWLQTKGEQMSAADAVTGQVKMVNWASSGFFKASSDAAAERPKMTPTLTPIVTTSAKAQSLAVSMVGYPPDPKKLFASFVPGNEKLTLAARLFGPAQSAFAEGPPKNPDGTSVSPAEQHLAQSARDINVLLFADADVITDALWMRAQDFFGQRLVSKFADNGDMVVAGADNLAGSEDLIQVRARRESARPFVKVDEIERTAQQQFQKEEVQLQSKIEQAQQRIAELSKAQGTQATGAVVLTAEQQAEIAKVREEMVVSRKELRKVRATSRAEIERLGNKLRFINIALVPLVLTGAALVLWMVRGRARRRA